MLMTAEGRIEGTIGGGAIEYQSEKIAEQVLHEKKTRVKKFILAPNKTEDIGMLCGGNAEILFQFISWKNQEIPAICEAASRCIHQNQAGWLISEYKENAASTLGFYSEKDHYIGLTEELPQQLLTRQIQQATLHGKNYYILPILTEGTVYVFGGGHVAQALVPILKSVDFYCAVFDDRPEYVSQAVFPQADERILGNFENISSSFQLTGDDYCIVVTHSADLVLTQQILRLPHFYLGILASQHKVATFKKKLQESGFTEAEMHTIDMPIGVKAETPAEIAISIVNELIRLRREK